MKIQKLLINPTVIYAGLNETQNGEINGERKPVTVDYRLAAANQYGFMLGGTRCQLK